MASDTIDNDAAIAQALAEEYELYPSSFNPNSPEKSRSYSPIQSEECRLDNVQQVSNNSSSDQKNRNCLQINDDAEMAFIMQIEEIFLLETKMNGKTIKPTDGQLEKTHANMTKALQPTGQEDLLARMFGMFVTIQTRYTNCQVKNQVLIDQIQKLSVELYPALIALKAPGRIGAPKAVASTLAIGLITNVLQGTIKLDDAKQIMFNMVQIWQESNVWYEFLEQLVYILVALTVPSFAQGAMGKIMAKISSS